MKKIVMVADHFYNCPICGKECVTDTDKGAGRIHGVQGPGQVFFCYNPLANDPLHYYSHRIDKSDPNRVAYQEFSLDLGNKSVIFGINYLIQNSFIKTSNDKESIQLPFVIEPDFPYLVSVKSKVRTAIIFS